MIVDTTILVDLFRNNEKAKKFLLKEPNLLISRISMMELAFGSPSKKVLNLIKSQILALNIGIIEINEAISYKSGEIFEDYFHSTGIGIIDSIIAATAINFHEDIATHNLKHFQKIKEIKIFRPYLNN